MCRKFHGAAYATLVAVQRSSFHWISGDSLLSEYKADNGTVRTFCPRCGSSLFFASPKVSDDVIEIALAVFDEDVPVAPDAHIFCDFGASFTTKSDALPRHSEGRNSPLVRST